MNKLLSKKTMKTVLFWSSIILLFLGTISYLVSCFSIPIMDNDKLKDFALFAIILSRFTDLLEKEFKIDKENTKE